MNSIHRDSLRSSFFAGRMLQWRRLQSLSYAARLSDQKGNSSSFDLLGKEMGVDK
jgi:hypothetical protein